MERTVRFEIGYSSEMDRVVHVGLSYSSRIDRVAHMFWKKLVLEPAVQQCFHSRWASFGVHCQKAAAMRGSAAARSTLAEQQAFKAPSLMTRKLKCEMRSWVNRGHASSQGVPWSDHIKHNVPHSLWYGQWNG